jgi:hypothetical protein
VRGVDFLDLFLRPYARLVQAVGDTVGPALTGAFADDELTDMDEC